MPTPGETGFQPHLGHLAQLIRGVQKSAQSEDVGIVVLPAVYDCLQIVAEGGPDSPDLVADHARADAGAVDHDADVGAPLGDRVGDRARSLAVDRDQAAAEEIAVSGGDPYQSQVIAEPPQSDGQAAQK